MISIRKVKNSLVAPSFKVKTLENKQETKHRPFQFSKKMDYGLFLLIELAKNQNSVPVSLRAVAEKNQMSFFFLQKAAHDLKQAQLIKSSRGKDGGYLLNRTVDQISLKEILEALEGRISVMNCLNHSPEIQTCIRESWCTMRSGLDLINQTLLKAFQQVTLDQFLKPHSVNFSTQS